MNLWNSGSFLYSICLLWRSKMKKNEIRCTVLVPFTLLPRLKTKLFGEFAMQNYLHYLLRNYTEGGNEFVSESDCNLQYQLQGLHLNRVHFRCQKSIWNRLSEYADRQRLSKCHAFTYLFLLDNIHPQSARLSKSSSVGILYGKENQLSSFCKNAIMHDEKSAA